MPAAWRLLRQQAGSASWNMSLDEALLEGAAATDAPATLRLYSWQRLSLTLGYRQRAGSAVERCADRGVEVARRCTGGGSVLHSGDLTYAVIVPAGHPDLPEGLGPSYCWIRGVLIDALRDLGVAAMASVNTRGAARADLCFQAATGSEVSVDAQKLIGSAQRRTRWGLLQHGSIRLRDDREAYRELFGGDPGPPAPVLQLQLPALSEALVRSFSRRLGGRLEAGELSTEEANSVATRQQLRAASPLLTPAISSRRFAPCTDMLP
jgi:lipoate-protein ligase A